MRVNERFKNKNKPKSRDIQIDDLAHKNCNGIIKGWHHCLCLSPSPLPSQSGRNMCITPYRLGSSGSNAKEIKQLLADIFQNRCS